MNTTLITGRAISLLLGYCFGCLLTAAIVIPKLTGRSPYKYGSHNPGAANVAANAGLPYGVLVLVGDVVKSVIPCVIAYSLFGDCIGRIVIMYAGLGAVLGHNYPFWHRFKGGKGVAATCTSIIFYAPLAGTLSSAAGLLCILVTGFLPLGAIVIPAVFTVVAFLTLGAECGLLSLVSLLLMLIAHREGLRKVRDGEELKKFR